MDRSVLHALRWIKTQQHPNGSFGNKFPVAMTSFALLAYCGHCETVDSPEFGKSVKAAIEYLLAVAGQRIKVTWLQQEIAICLTSMA